MRCTLCLLTTCLLILNACHKTTPPATSSGNATEKTNATAAAEVDASASDQNPASSPGNPLPPPPPPSPVVKTRAVNAVRQNVIGEVDSQLTEELRNFVQQKQRMPQTFSEFATLRLDSIPRPPAGKKWVIDGETIEVKAVAAQ